MELTPVEWLQVQIKNCPTAENLMNNINGFLKEAKLMEKNQALSQHDVSGSLVSPDAVQKEAERFQKATINKMAIERIAFAQGALWVRSMFLPNDH
jgi:hypothetical protein